MGRKRLLYIGIYDFQKAAKPNDNYPLSAFSHALALLRTSDVSSFFKEVINFWVLSWSIMKFKTNIISNK